MEFDVTLLDNTSTDATMPLFNWARRQGIHVAQSGFTTSEAANTHGEVVARFILESPLGGYFLLLDADVCFLRSGTVSTMRLRLDAEPGLFAVQAEMRLFATESLGIRPRTTDHIEQSDGTRRRLFPRPHPFCLLVRDSAVFRRVVEHIALSPAIRFAASSEVAGSYDTFGLAAAALATHGLGWTIAGGPVLHYAQAAERRDSEELMKLKDEDCAHRLELLRRVP